MPKIEADNLKYISTLKLKDSGLLHVSQDVIQKSIILTWSRLQFSTSKPDSSIQVTIAYSMGQPSIMTLKYTLTKTNEDRVYSVKFERTRPNFGGFRWYFKCPNIECDNKCTKLYLAYTYFLCRKCHDLTYESNNRSAKLRSFDRLLDLMPGFTETPSRIDKLIAKVERYPNYKGQPTRANVKLEQIRKNIPSRTKVNKILQL